MLRREYKTKGRRIVAETLADSHLIEILYEKYAEQLRKRAGSIINDWDLSEDIVQECMLYAVEHIDCIKKLNEPKQGAYLASTVEALSKNYVAGRKSRIILIEFEEVFFSRLLIPEESPETKVEEKLNFELLKRALNSMNENDRKVIELKYIFRLSDHEIAPILGIKENSVRMTVRRSVFRLKKQLGLIHNYESIH